MHILAWQQDGPAKKAPKTATEQKKAGNPKPQGKVGANFTLLSAKSTLLLLLVLLPQNVWSNLITAHPSELIKFSDMCRNRIRTEVDTKKARPRHKEPPDV